MEDWLVSPDGSERTKQVEGGWAMQYKQPDGSWGDRPRTGDAPVSTHPEMTGTQRAIQRQLANPPVPGRDVRTAEQEESRQNSIRAAQMSNANMQRADQLNDQAIMGEVGVGMQIPFTSQIIRFGRNSYDNMFAQINGARDRVSDEPGQYGTTPASRAEARQMMDGEVANPELTRIFTAAGMTSTAIGQLLNRPEEMERWLKTVPSSVNRNRTNTALARAIVRRNNKTLQDAGITEGIVDPNSIEYNPRNPPKSDERRAPVRAPAVRSTRRAPTGLPTVPDEHPLSDKNMQRFLERFFYGNRKR